jgi:hypothetical protein
MENSKNSVQKSDSSGPLPPPNFDDNWAGSEAVSTNVNEEPVIEPEPTLVAKKTVKTQGGKTVAVPGNGNHRARTVVVEIKAAGNWRDACRRTLETARTHSGEDDLRLHIAGQDLAMDFPACGTRFCDDLVQDLERIPGIVRVYDS